MLRKGENLCEGLDQVTKKRSRRGAYVGRRMRTTVKERDEQVSRDQKRYSRVNKAKCNERYKLTTRFGVSEQQIEEERGTKRQFSFRKSEAWECGGELQILGKRDKRKVHLETLKHWFGGLRKL